MLSLFPVLFSYSLAVPFVFRLVVGMIFIFFAYSNGTKFKQSKIAFFEKTGSTAPRAWLWTLMITEMLGGCLLVVGLWTQATSLALSVILLVGIVLKHKNIGPAAETAECGAYSSTSTRAQCPHQNATAAPLACRNKIDLQWSVSFLFLLFLLTLSLAFLGAGFYALDMPL